MLTQEQYDRDIAELCGEKLRFVVGCEQTPPTLERWKANFHDVSPAEICQRFRRAAGASNDVKIRILFSPTNAELVVHHNTPWDENDNRIRFTLRQEGNAYLDGLFLQAGDQGKQLGGRYLRAIVDLAQDTGQSGLGMWAQDVGSYAWAKYGIMPASKSDWHDLQAAIESRLLDSGGFCLLRTDDNALLNVTPELPFIKRLLRTSFHEMPQVFPQIAALNRVLVENDGRPLTVGKALLTGLGWEGRLSFDAESPGYKRFEYYTQAAMEQQHERG